MKPLKVVGWEAITGKNGKPGVRIYCEREINTGAEGFIEGQGLEAVRLYINPEYCDYKPCVGDTIIPVEGRFGIDSIYVL